MFIKRQIENEKIINNNENREKYKKKDRERERKGVIMYRCKNMRY
jgi:hypothetical protein